MSAKNFQYKLANIDMKEFYNEMMCYHMDWPEVILVEEIENGSDVLRKEMENGNHLIYLRNSENKLDVLQKELVMNEAEIVPALPFEHHTLTNEELMTWIACACYIADLLDIRCPQIFFTPFEDAGSAAGEGMLCLPDKKPYGKQNVLEMFVCIAHELRHEWQYINHPDWFEGYVNVESEEDIEAYLNHKTEIDAEAFARKLTGRVFGVSLFKGEDQKLIEKLLNRAQEINIPISEDEIDMFVDLFEAEEWMENYDEEYEDELEIDGEYFTFSMMSTIDLYAELQRIKCAEDRDKEIEFALKNCEAKLRVGGINPNTLKM